MDPSLYADFQSGVQVRNRMKILDPRQESKTAASSPQSTSRKHMKVVQVLKGICPLSRKYMVKTDFDLESTASTAPDLYSAEECLSTAL